MDKDNVSRREDYSIAKINLTELLFFISFIAVVVMWVLINYRQ